MSENRTESVVSSTISLFSQRFSFNRTLADQEENYVMAEEVTTSGDALVANEPNFTPSKFVLHPEEDFTVVNGEADPSMEVRE